MAFTKGDRVRLTRPAVVRTDRGVVRAYRPCDRFTVIEAGVRGVWCADRLGQRVPLPAGSLEAVDVRDEVGAT